MPILCLDGTPVEATQGWSKKKILGVAALSVIGVLVAASWAWDATHHDDHGPHGAPLTASQIEDELAGAGFSDEYGRPKTVRGAACRPGEDGYAVEPATHFRCELKFDNGADTGAVHVLPDELLFNYSSG